MEGHYNKDICKGCGKCCKQSGCGYLPSDFEKMSYNYLKSKLEEGNMSIVAEFQFDINSKNKMCWYPILIIQARNESKEIIDLVSYDSCCSMLRDNGCYYKDWDRPSYGRFLKPDENHNCKQMIQKEESIKLWAKYQDTLSSLVSYFSNMNVTEKIDEDINELKDEIVRRYPEYFIRDENGELRQIKQRIIFDEETNEFLGMLTLKSQSIYSIDGSSILKKYNEKKKRKK